MLNLNYIKDAVYEPFNSQARRKNGTLLNEENG